MEIGQDSVVDLARLRAFVTVGQVGSVTGAARLLHLAQPALSRQLRQLEAEVGVRLLDRHRSGVSLTVAGEVLAAQAETLLRGWADALEATRRAGASWERLRIGVWPYTAFDDVERLHRWCAQQHPGAEVSLSTIPAVDPADQLLRGVLDLAFARPPVRTAGGVASQVVRTETLVAAVPARHRLARLREVPLADLVAEPWALYPCADDPEWVDGLLGTCERLTGRRPLVRFAGSVAIDNLPHVATGAAVTVVSSSLAETVTVAGVRYRPLAGNPLAVPLLMAWRAGDRSAVLAMARAEALRSFAAATATAGPVAGTHRGATA
jgi:DNA-binding transcriptional LysR family regulator